MKLQVLTAFVLGGVLIILSSPTVGPSRNNLRDAPVLAPPPVLAHFAFGFNDIFADSLWIRVIQDIDFCHGTGGSQTKSAQRANRIEIVRRQKKNLTDADLAEISKEFRCNDSWVFKMLDTITEIAPRFQIAYHAGAIALSVLVDDISGATKLFEKGIRNLPPDWAFLSRASYHYLYELDDKQRAAELFVAAADSGGPAWMKVLASKLQIESGDDLLAKITLEGFLKDFPQYQNEPKIRSRLDEIEKNLSKGKAAQPK